MRPNQQNNRRSRGRNNNQSNNNNSNRRSPNPLTRSYESNGPDVKIRGNAQTVAEKYMTLARDAHSAGDRVMAENYLQHAEHYNRIIAMAQAQQAEQQARRDQDNSDNQSDNQSNDQDDDDHDFDNDGQNDRQHDRNDRNNDHAEALENQRRNQQRQKNLEDAPQPDIHGTPVEVNFDEEKASGNKADRPRRTRRPRKTEDETVMADASSGDESQDAVAQAEGEEAPVKAKPKTRRAPRAAKPKDDENSGAEDTTEQEVV